MPRTDKSPLLGLCPIGKFVFSHEDAMRQKSLLVEELKRVGTNYVDIDELLPDGMVRDQSHVGTVVEHFRRQGIDALFIPHCNFGTEGAAAMIARHCGVPTLLWAPLDEGPLADGSRLRDSLCGTLATSGVLKTLRVPFSYIPTCRVDDPEFGQGFDRFMRAARVVKSLKTMRIGQIGQRIDFFWTTIIDEADLLQRFGVQMLPIDMVEVISKIRRRTEENRAAYVEELRGFEKWIDFNHFPDEDQILHNLAFRDIALDLAEEYDLDGLCLQSFNSVPEELGAFLSFGCGLIGDRGITVAPESDLLGAVSSILLEAARASETPSFLPDITIRHPDNPNAVLLWHGDAPLSLRAADAHVKIDLPWILKDLSTGLVHFKLKGGPLTICRFAGSSGEYRLGVGEGRAVEGPYTQEFYTWCEVDDWPTWERQLIEGPYIHHCSCVHEHCADVFEEAARFMPELRVERFGATQPWDHTDGNVDHATGRAGLPVASTTGKTKQGSNGRSVKIDGKHVLTNSRRSNDVADNDSCASQGDCRGSEARNRSGQGTA
ncbi:MAG: hypothetical protein U9N87_11675 [Planctomycetota bacterium]|nr:hypothetical protein [Planctomycetota bacterium]